MNLNKMENKMTEQEIKGIDSFKVITYFHRDKIRDKKVAFQRGYIVIRTNFKLGIRKPIKVMFGVNKTKDQATKEALELSGMRFVKLGKEKEFIQQRKDEERQLKALITTKRSKHIPKEKTK